MPFKIKITNEPVDNYPHRLVGGASGKEYLFLADPDLKAYAYTPQSAEEAEDIFGAIAIPFHPFRYMPVDIVGVGKAALPGTIPPWIAPDKYKEHTDAELVALARDCGFVPRWPEHPERVRAQLDAYFMGRAIGEKLVKDAEGRGSLGEASPSPVPPVQEEIEV